MAEVIRIVKRKKDQLFDWYISKLIINMIIVLLRVLILRQVLCAIPMSYVATPMFGAYQATFKLTATPPAVPPPITSSTSSLNPFTVNFKETRTGLTLANTFLTLGGFEKDTSSSECSFKISVAAVIPTQVLLGLTVIGSSTFQSLTFFVVITSANYNMYVDAFRFQSNALLNSVGAARDYSAIQNAVTSVNYSFRCTPLLSYFSLTNSNSSYKFQVGIQMVGSTTSSPVYFRYYVDQETDLTQIGLVILFYADVGSYPTDYVIYPFSLGSYSTKLGDAVILTPDGYVNGFEDKCIMGFEDLIFDKNFGVTFNMSNIYPATSYTSTDASLQMKLFCLIKDFDCSTIDVNCQICISYTVCSQCKSTYFPYVYANLSSKCQSCAVVMTGCSTCTSSTSCSTCIFPSYLMDTGSVCSPCSKFITNCLNCTSTTTCTGCVSSYGLDSTNICRLCYTMMTGCQLCLNYHTCTKCLNGYYIDTNGICQICSTAINNCAICENSTFCNLCNSDSYLNPTSSSCICNSGLYPISGLCSVPGCSSAYRFNSNTVCLSCNTSSSFAIAGTSCDCMIGYLVNGNTCNVVCGDSRLINEQCDDGNVINGDGCSSTCTVETNYECVNGTINTVSVCVYIGPISVSLNNIVKTPSSNQAVLTFTISPPALALNSMDFQKYTKLTIGGQVISCNSQSPVPGQTINCTCSYDQQGTMSIQVDYGTDLEGFSTQMTLSYDSTKVNLPDSVVDFSMAGSNLPVLRADISSLEQKVYIMGYVLAALYMLVLLLSTIFHKMIGLQTIQILQNVFFVRYLLSSSSPYVFSNINSIKYINGYNIFSQYTNLRLLDSSLIRMGIGKNFVFNVMAQAGIVVIMWIVSTLCARKVRMLKLTKAEFTSSGMQILKRAQLLEAKFSNAAFIFSVYSFYLVVFSLLSSVQTPDELNFQLPRILFTFTILVMFYQVIYMVGSIYTNWKPKFDQDQGLNFKYISVFLIYHMLMSILMVALPQASFGKFIIAACQLIYIVYLIAARPYFLKVQNVLLIFSQFAGIGFTAWTILSDFVTFDNQLLHQIMMGYEGLLSLVGVLAIVRLYLHFKDNEKAFKLMHQEEDKMKGKDLFSKTQFKKQQDLLKVQKAKPTLSQKKKIEENQELQELQRIKNRLKGQHKIKLMEEAL